MAPFIWRDGVHVVGTALWCDARRARSLSFLSHAGRRAFAPSTAGRARRGGQSRQLLYTEGTARLLAALSPGGKGDLGADADALRCPYGRPFSLGLLRLELFPSGYLPGAASLLVTMESGGGGRRHLVYAGDVNQTPSPLCEPMQVRAAEAIVCHAPLAALGLPLPSRAEAEARLLLHVEAAVSDGACAVLLVPELGLGQDLLHFLRGAFPGRAAPPIFAAASILAALAAAQPASPASPRPGASPPLPVAQLFGPRSGPRPGTVLLWPQLRSLSPLLRPFATAGAGARPPLRLLLCAGAALCEEATARYRLSLGKEAAELPFAAVPFPDGLDLPGLLDYITVSEAREVYLTAGASPLVERALSGRRVRLLPLGPPRQLDLFAA